jgi:hypothetical protein
MGALYTFPPISCKFTRNYKEFTRNDFHSWSFLVRVIWQRIPAKLDQEWTRTTQGRYQEFLEILPGVTRNPGTRTEQGMTRNPGQSLFVPVCNSLAYLKLRCLSEFYSNICCQTIYFAHISGYRGFMTIVFLHPGSHSNTLFFHYFSDIFPIFFAF